jgi:hypothetical protein
MFLGITDTPSLIVAILVFLALPGGTAWFTH